MTFKQGDHYTALYTAVLEKRGRIEAIATLRSALVATLPRPRFSQTPVRRHGSHRLDE
jgi:hypothetical protein